MPMIVKNVARLIKHNQHCIQFLLPQRKREALPQGALILNLADTRGAYSRGDANSMIYGTHKNLTYKIAT